MTDYANSSMTGISDTDYENLSIVLSDRLAALIPWAGENAHNAATDMLANTWDDGLTANEWFAAARKRLGA